MATKNLILESLSRLFLPLGMFLESITFCRLFPKKTDLSALMKFYDTDGDGNITYEEFLSGLR
jgi:Ca2+-binding EF-hand superfamily protein